MKVKELLTKQNWIRIHFAVDEIGRPVQPDDPRACRFCLAGAIRRCYKSRDRVGVYRRMIAALRPCGFGSVVAFNDNKSTSFEDVHKLVTELDI